MTNATEHYDVAIIGGGLAGLTLALQINQSAPGLAVAVLERDTFPAATAAHKVGESTVEIGAHYLAHTLGLRDLLERTQLRKFGLRYFFGSGYHKDLADADELGISSVLPVISYQLDRGTLENDLAESLRMRGVDVRDGCKVRNATASSTGNYHKIMLNENNDTWSLSCRWLVDASSRTALLKRALKIGKASGHQMCAAWCRLDTSISVDEWSNCADWKKRCHGLSRRLSTNHLMGNGYWAWIIPLPGGRTSVGLVADPAVHSLDSFSNFDRFHSWLGEHQHLLAAELYGASDTLMDFRILKNLSQDSERLWSADGWAMTGEAGLFTDPFYSPGTDFIALSNTFICDMITTQRSQAELAIHSMVFEKLYQSFFGSTMSLYENLYRGFGDTRLMVVKSTWDYAFYWSILAWLFFREVLTDVEFIRCAQRELGRIRALNFSMQAEFKKRANDNHIGRGGGRFFDQVKIPVLSDLKAALLEPGECLQKELAQNCQRLDILAPSLLSILAGNKGGTSRCSLLGDLGRQLN